MDEWVEKTSKLTIIGSLVGGLLGALEGRKQYFAENKNLTPVTAAESLKIRYSNVGARQKSINGFLKRGWYFGSRIGLFAGVLNAVEISLRNYREKTDFVNYLVAGFSSSLAFSVGGRLGWRYGRQFVLIGTAAGLTLGILQEVQTKFLTQEPIQEGKNELTEEEIMKRKLDFTTTMIQGLESSLKETSKPEEKQEKQENSPPSK